MLSFTGIGKWRAESDTGFLNLNKSLASDLTEMSSENKNLKGGTGMKNLIGYEWKEASNGAKIEVVNPATSELIDTVPNLSLIHI